MPLLACPKFTLGDIVRFICKAACVAMAPFLTAATEPLRLQPSSKWIVDYGDNSCRLIRAFGQGETKVFLVFESQAPGQMDMTVTGKPLSGRSEAVDARFLPIGGKFSGAQRATTVKNKDPAIIWSTVSWLPEELAEKTQRTITARDAKFDVRPPPIDLADRTAKKLQRQQFAGKATALEIRTRPNHPVILETGSLAKPIEAFDECSRNSLKDWGVDPDLEDRIVRPAWSPGGAITWFSSSDYPTDMIILGKESIVTIRVLVDAAGNVSRCTSLSHFDAPEFDQITCKAVMRRAKLEPAELADGTKVPTYQIIRIRWRMPR